MKVEIISVTPAIARDWLRFNTDNRPLRRSVVDGFKDAMARGEYVATHQGIAFSEQGTLLDGQHRLTAISEMTEGSFQMLVSWGISVSAFKVMDIGLRRTASDALKEDARLVEAARLIAVICDTKRTSITPTMLIPFIDKIAPLHSDLMSFCPRKSRPWSCAAVRVAAVVSGLHGVDFDYTKTVYRSLVWSDFDTMPPVAQSLVRAHQIGAIRAQASVDMMARCLVAFDPKNSRNVRVQIKDASKALSLVRSHFDFAQATSGVLDGFASPKKKAAHGSAAKSVLPKHFSAARASV